MSRGGGRPIGNTDAMSAAGPVEYLESPGSAADYNVPPGYVKPVDEGRPRK